MSRSYSKTEFPSDKEMRILAAVPTPFTSDNNVNNDALIGHARWLLDNGCDGIVLFGTTGEAASLTLAERIKTLESLVLAGLNPDHLIVGTGCCAIQDTVALSQHAIEIGAGTLVLAPYFFRPVENEGVINYFKAVLQELSNPDGRVYLYNIPQIVGSKLPLPIVQSLTNQFQNLIRGYKDSSGDFENTLSIVEGTSGLDVYCGSEAKFSDLIRAGGSGCISATANVQPGAIRSILNDLLAGQEPSAQAEVAIRRKSIEAYPLVPAVKAMLAKIHGDNGWISTRPPIMPLPTLSIEDLWAKVRLV